MGTKIRILKSTTAPRLSELATNTYSLPCKVACRDKKNLTDQHYKDKAKAVSQLQPATIKHQVCHCSLGMGTHHHVQEDTFT